MDTDGISQAHVLVIDDDEVMREILPALLGTSEGEIEVMGSGSEAIARLKRSPAPQVILSDLQMPELSGAALMSALREAAPGTPLVGMSATRPADEVLRGLDGFVLKPFTAADLAQAIEDARKRGARAALPVEATAHPPASESEQQPVLDEDIFGKMASCLKPADLLQVYELTLSDVLERHKRLEDHAAAGDLDAVKREAHAIKGVCGMMGARELQHLAAATEGGTTVNTSAISDFPAACSRLRRMLDAKFHNQI